jgi:dTDP-4-dehydrorhamnose 3,5-epimerase
VVVGDVDTVDGVRFESVELEGVWVIELDRHRDERGWFARAFCEDEFAAHGLPTEFPQCNISSNAQGGTMRGMHFNVASSAEAKYVRCVRGAVYDVVIDLRAGSPTEHRWVGFELSADNGVGLFVPKGFAHGFLTLHDDTDVHYHMSERYRPDAARGLRWDDPAFDIRWPRDPVVIAERDATYADYTPDVLRG